MNKKLLTAAIGAALAAGPMLASTAVADVKVYGKLHVSVDFLDPKGGGESTANTQSTSEATARKSTGVSSNASRWGIKISEKLGGGMTAIGQLEQQINVDGEVNSQDSRSRFVGLQGGWGTILAGINDTPFKMISRTVELFPEYVGDNRNLVSTGAAGGLGWDLRPPNAVHYISPSLNGFVAEYLYSADTAAGAVAGTTGLEDNRRRVDSLGVKYAKGPLYAAFAYETHRLFGVNTSAGGNPTEKGYRFGASYNFGAFKLTGMYQDLKDLGGVTTGGSSIKRKAWALGGAYTAGNNVFKLQYVKLDKRSNDTAGSSAATDNTGSKMWALGWDHLFSKTTKGYVAYAKTDNETGANAPVNGPGGGARSDALTPVAGGDPTVWSVGMVVDF